MRSTSFFWFCLLLICNAAFSQTDSDVQKTTVLLSLKKGQSIKVEAIGLGVIEGIFREIKNDTLLLSSGLSKVFAIPFSDLQTLWVRANSAREGGRIGAILGAIPGALLGGNLAADLANIDCESHCVNPIGPMLLGGAIGGLIGAAGGAMIGTAFGAAIPQWQRGYP